MRTTNGGMTWEQSLYEAGPYLNSVFCIDNNIGWIAGEAGLILKTTDGGLSWDKLVSGSSQDLGSVQFVDSQIGWAVGANGKILKTTNGGITSVSKNEIKYNPHNFYLSQNYPNPFNPSTTIKYSIPTQSPLLGGARGGSITLKVYDILGNEVATLVNEEKPAGNYEVTWNAEGLSSGVYFFQLKGENYVETKKMILLR